MGKLLMKEFVSELLDCGELDIDVLLRIDKDILFEAIERLKDEGAKLNFPAVFTEAVRVAQEKHDLNIVEIDANYLAARVYAADKKSGRILEKLGFPVVY